MPHVLCDEINYKSVKVFATHGTANKFIRCNAKNNRIKKYFTIVLLKLY